MLSSDIGPGLYSRCRMNIWKSTVSDTVEGWIMRSESEHMRYLIPNSVVANATGENVPPEKRINPLQTRKRWSDTRPRCTMLNDMPRRYR